MTNPLTWTFSASLYSAINLGKFYVNGHAHVSICSSYVVLEKFVPFANACVVLYAFYTRLERCIGMRINVRVLCLLTRKGRQTSIASMETFVHIDVVPVIGTRMTNSFSISLKFPKYKSIKIAQIQWIFRSRWL